jgi:hypothetical protein
MKLEMKRSTLQTVLAIAFAALTVWAILWGVWRIDDIHLTKELKPAVGTTVSGLRTAIVAVSAAIVATWGARLTARTISVHRDGQVTDRYTKAIEQLASDRQIQQLGGIYALERIMRDSPADQSTIAEVLASFIREMSPAGANTSVRIKRPVNDPVHAAIKVLARRAVKDEGSQLNLRGTNLSGVDLSSPPDYSWRANLQNADLIGSVLTHAHLRGANLKEATLINVNFFHTNMEGVQLDNADLSGARLQEARYLTADQVRTARPDHNTCLPGPIDQDPDVENRKQEVTAAGYPDPPGGRPPCGCETLQAW